MKSSPPFHRRPWIPRLECSWQVLMLACVCIGLAGCSGSESTGSRETGGGAPGSARLSPEDFPDPLIVEDIEVGEAGGRLLLSLAGDVKTFNPALEEDHYSSVIRGHQFEQLVYYDNAAQEEKPGLSTSWSFDEEALTWTFKLREGLKWSDGEPLTADDFLFAVEVIRDPTVSNDYKSHFEMDGVPYEFSAPDPLTLVVKIPELDSFSMFNLSQLWPLPRHMHEAALKAGNFSEALGTNTPPDQIVVSGPFKVREFKSAQHVILERNPYYYRFDSAGTQLPYLDEVYYIIVEDFGAQAIRFLDGDIDLMDDIQPENLAGIQDGAEAGDFTVMSPGLRLELTHYWFNQNGGGAYDGPDGERVKWQPEQPGDEPPGEIRGKNFEWYVDPVKRRWFANVDFRRACALATDRQAICDTVLYGLAEPAHCFEPASNKRWFNPDVPRYDHDPAAARELLDRIGYVDRNNDGLREDDEGNTIRFNLVTNKERRYRQDIILLIQENLREVGIGVSTQTLDFNDIVSRLSDTYDYEACLLGWVSGVPPHPAMGANVWPSSSRLHHHWPEQPQPMTEWEAEVDRLYLQMRQVFEYEEQKDLYDRMLTLWADNLPTIELMTPRLHVAYRNNLGNLKPTMLRPELTHNIHEIYVKRSASR